MARFRVQVGKVFYRNPPFASSPAYLSYMREASQAMMKAYEEMFRQVESMTPDIMVSVLEPTFAKAKFYTPVDTGALVRSGYLVKRPFRGVPRAEMGFARGGSPEYAAIVHEQIDVPHAAPTRSKFLEAAMMEDIADIRKRLINIYRGIL